MPKIHFDLNSRGVEELLTRAEMRALVNSYAQQIAGRASSMSGESYKAVSLGYHRAKAIVEPGNWAARRENLKNNTLEKAWRG